MTPKKRRDRPLSGATVTSPPAEPAPRRRNRRVARAQTTISTDDLRLRFRPDRWPGVDKRLLGLYRRYKPTRNSHRAHCARGSCVLKYSRRLRDRDVFRNILKTGARNRPRPAQRWLRSGNPKTPRSCHRPIVHGPILPCPCSSSLALCLLRVSPDVQWIHYKHTTCRFQCCVKRCRSALANR